MKFWIFIGFYLIDIRGERGGVNEGRYGNG